MNVENLFKCLLVVLASLNPGFATSADNRVAPGRLQVHAIGKESPGLNLRNGAEIATTVSAANQDKLTQPLALAAADFDEDGVPDLVSSYGSSQLSVMRGNVDAIYPNSPEAKARRQRGEFTDAAFLGELNRITLPEPADLIGTGDFDADGHWDIVATRQGGDKLYWLRGDGHGGFAAPKIVYLSGSVTSMVTGEMNRTDGLTDVAVGVVTSDGPRVLVFESPNGALRGEPESFVLPAPASALALGQLDDDAAADLAIATGNEVMIVHGRDRKLSLDAEQRATVKAAEISRTALESAAVSIAVGDFTGDAKQELAVLTADGNMRVLERGGASSKEFLANKAMTLNVATSGPDGGAPHRILATKVSSLPKDDLLVFGGTKAVSIVTPGRTPALGQPNLTSAGSDRMSLAASLGSDSEVTAVLPMRLNASALKTLVVLEKNGTAPSVVAPQASATFVVNITGNTNDKNPGDGICADTDGNCSYDAALQESNAHAGADTINFNIPGNGVPKIISSGLFGGIAITDPVTIDGTTQPGGRVEIAAGGGNGIQLFGGNSVVRGLATYADNYVFIVRSSGNIIEGNYIGLKADGTKPAAGINVGDIVFDANSPANNLIGGTTAQARNIISGSNQGLLFGSAGPGNIIRGNYFGTNPSGTAAIANNAYAIRLLAPADYTVGGATAGAGNLISGNGQVALSVEAGTALIQGNRFGTTADGTQPIANGGDAIDVNSSQAVTIGGTTPAARNVISASATGIRIRYTAGTNSLIQGNFIGTNAAGTGALPNLGDGVLLGGAVSITIGGITAGGGNLISGNGGYGIHISGGVNSLPSRAVMVQGNLVGTDVNGVEAIPNTAGGVFLETGLGTLIGGTTAEARNVISGNSKHGIILYGGDASDPNRIEGNYIGVNRFGTGALGNAIHGIFYRAGGNNNIGGLAPGAGNRIAFNRGAGIASDNYTALGGAILSNSIFSNSDLGIDLGDDGVTLAAGGFSFDNPVLTSVTTSGSNTTITGRLRTYNIGTGQTPFTIQFFSNISPDPSGYGQGQVFIGQTTVTAGSFATVSFTATITPAVTPGRFISAVAVGSPDINFPSLGLYSSEFSFCVRTAGNPTPENTPLSLRFTSPSVSGDTGSSTVTIFGEGIQQGATVVLRRAGQSDIVGQNVVISPDGLSVTARFDLTGQPVGEWDLVVTNPGGATSALTSGFFVRKGREAQVWVDVIGRYTLRSSLEQTFYITYGNSGDVDAPSTQIQVAIPQGLSVIQLPQLVDGSEPSFIPFPGGGGLLRFLVTNVTANSAISLPIRLKTSAELAHQEVELQANAFTTPAYQEIASSEIDPGVMVSSEVTINTPDHAQMIAAAVDSEGNRDEYTVDVTISDGTLPGSTPVTPDSVQVTIVETEDTTESTIVIAIPNAAENLGSGQQSVASADKSPNDEPFLPAKIYKHVVKANKIRKTAKQGLDVLKKHSQVNAKLKEVDLQKYIIDCFRRPSMKARNFPIDAAEFRTLQNLSDGAVFTGKVKYLMSVAALAHKGPSEEITRGIDVIDKTMSRQFMDEITRVVARDIFNNSIAPGNQLGLNQRYDEKMQNLFREYYLQSSFGRDIFKYYQLNEADKKADEERATVLRLRVLKYLIRSCCRDKYGNIVPPRTDVDGSSLLSPQNSDCGCKDCDELEKILKLLIVFSWDPNDKSGPQGSGTPHYITGTPPLSYAIFFENKPEATAPAQGVVITDRLDTSKFDLSTFQLGPITFGKNTVITPPAGLPEWTKDIDLRPQTNLIVRLIAAIDKTTGVVTWRFISLDPVTMQPTDDARAGFLPPNKNASEGEGAVGFTIRAKTSLPTGTEVRNKARIVFDKNASIDTPEWLNTIDNSPPVSQVFSLPPSQSSTHFQVSWAGSDSGSGITSYTIYVSENGGPFVAWLENTSLTSAFYDARPNSTLAFYSVAHDGAGNDEAAKVSADTTVTVPSGQLLNISTRLRVQTGDNVLIGGFIVTGADSKRIIVRGIGPSLANSGVTDALGDTTLELYQGATLIASNDNWKESQQAEIEATTIPPSNDLESAIVRTLPPGAYTAILRGKNNLTGIGLVEAYDLDQAANSKPANISTRGFVDTADNVMIGGLIVGGHNGSGARVVVRAIGPSLTASGVAGALADPTLELHDGNGATLATNDNWKESQQAEIVATTLAPSDDRESAIVTTLTAGNYTAIVRGVGATTGVGLVEVYNIP